MVSMKCSQERNMAPRSCMLRHQARIPLSSTNALETRNPSLASSFGQRVLVTSSWRCERLNFKLIPGLLESNTFSFGDTLQSSLRMFESSFFPFTTQSRQLQSARQHAPASSSKVISEAHRLTKRPSVCKVFL